MTGQTSDPDPIAPVVAWLLETRTALTLQEQRARLVAAGYDPGKIDLAEQRVWAMAAAASQPPTPPAQPVQPAVRKGGIAGRLFLLAIFAVAALFFLSSRFGGTGGGSGGAGGGSTNRTDAEIKAAMLSNIAYHYAEAEWYPFLLTDGSHLDIAVRGALAFVATRLPQADTTSAATICASIAAITNDSNTAEPLGISRVVVISGGKETAACSPP